MSDIEDIVQANSPYNDGWTQQFYKDKIAKDEAKLAEDIIDDKEKRYIYESPDGGKTVYRRAFGSDERELVEDFENEQNS